MSERRGRAARIAVALALLVLVTGCTSPAASGTSAPKLRPPAVAEAGVLRVAVDAHYPPFASFEGSRVVGIDADIASALAASLGLRAEFVDVPPAGIGDALRAKRVDVALGGIAITDAALSQVEVATSYLADAPALFARESSVTAEHIEGLRIAVQKDSASYWLLRDEAGEDSLVVVPTLRDAFVAAAAGKADAVAGDGIVGGYLRREFPSLVFAGQLADATPLAVMLSKDAAASEPAIRSAVDELAATGVIDAVRGKWLADMPAFTQPSDASSSTAAAASSIGEAAVAPGAVDPSSAPASPSDDTGSAIEDSSAPVVP